MTKTDWTAEEVRATVKKIKGHAMTVEERADMFDIAYAFAEHIEADGSAAPVVWVDPDDVAEKRKAVMGTADPYEHKGTRYKLPLFIHPPAQAAQVDVPDWRIAMFDRWREAAQEKGYAGIAEAINAVPDARQPAQETPCSLSEALNVIEHWGRRGNTLNGYDVDRFRALADKIAPAQEQPGWKAPDVFAKLYEAASKGFHTSESCGPESLYMHKAKFPTLQDLFDFEDAWRKAMLAASPTPPKEK